MEKKVRRWRRQGYFIGEGCTLEGLSNRVTFTSTETFRKGRRETFGCLEKESQGSGNSKFKVPKAGVCSMHLKSRREAQVRKAE